MEFDEMDEVEYIWMNGNFVDWNDAQIHVLTHGLHYGSTVFEGIRAYEVDDNAAIFRLDDHIDRFFDSAAPYDMDVGHNKEELRDATVELLSRHSFNGGYIRPIAYRGYKELGLSADTPTDVAIAAWPWGRYMGDDALEDGIKAKVASWEKFSSNAFPTTAKTGGAYANSLLAAQEAKRNGFDEAILLNSRGTVAEGPGENLFLVRDQELRTPPLADDLLSGITRDTIIELADDLGYDVVTESIARGELYTADELFYTGTAAEVTPIRQVDNVDISDGCGPVTEALQDEYFDLVEGRLDRYDDWFTFA